MVNLCSRTHDITIATWMEYTVAARRVALQGLPSDGIGAKAFPLRRFHRSRNRSVEKRGGVRYRSSYIDAGCCATRISWWTDLKERSQVANELPGFITVQWIWCSSSIFLFTSGRWNSQANFDGSFVHFFLL